MNKFMSNTISQTNGKHVHRLWCAASSQQICWECLMNIWQQFSLYLCSIYILRIPACRCYLPTHLHRPHSTSTPNTGILQSHTSYFMAIMDGLAHSQATFQLLLLRQIPRRYVGITMSVMSLSLHFGLSYDIFFSTFCWKTINCFSRFSIAVADNSAKNTWNLF